MSMKNLLFAATIIGSALVASSVHAQTTQTLLNEGFNNDGAGTRYTLSSQFNNPGLGANTGVFDVDTTNHGQYSNVEGVGIFFAQNPDSELGNGNEEQSIEFNTIDVSGLTDLKFSGSFASGDDDFYEEEEHIIINAILDGNVQRILQFEADVNRGVFDLLQDTDFNGRGDGTQLSSTFQAFNDIAISGTGSSLQIQALVASDSGFDIIGLDNFRVTGVTSVPEPSSAMMTALAFSTVVFRRRRKVS